MDDQLGHDGQEFEVAIKAGAIVVAAQELGLYVGDLSLVMGEQGKFALSSGIYDDIMSALSGSDPICCTPIDLLKKYVQVLVVCRKFGNYDGDSVLIKKALSIIEEYTLPTEEDERNAEKIVTEWFQNAEREAEQLIKTKSANIQCIAAALVESRILTEDEIRDLPNPRRPQNRRPNIRRLISSRSNTKMRNRRNQVQKKKWPVV